MSARGDICGRPETRTLKTLRPATFPGWFLIQPDAYQVRGPQPAATLVSEFPDNARVGRYRPLVIPAGLEPAKTCLGGKRPSGQASESDQCLRQDSNLQPTG